MSAEKNLRTAAEASLARAISSKGNLERFLEGVLRVRRTKTEGRRRGGGSVCCVVWSSAADVCFVVGEDRTVCSALSARGCNGVCWQCGCCLATRSPVFLFFCLFGRVHRGQGCSYREDVIGGRRSLLGSYRYRAIIGCTRFRVFNGSSILIPRFPI